MGLDRYSNTGDSTTGFWLFQDQVSLNPDGTFNGVHTDGDILIISDLKKAGGEADYHVYVWAGGGLSGPLSLPEDTAYAISNSATIPTAWPFTPKSGPANQYQPGMFLEAGLNLDALFEEVPCYTTFIAETRASESLTATLSDFVFGSINTCDPQLSISKTADEPTINAGDTASYTITVENTGKGPAQGVVITDLLPAGVDWTASAGTITNGTLTYAVGTMDPGETITIEVSGATTALNCGVLSDTATVTSINNEPSSLSATATITVNCPDLSIVKTADQSVIDAGETAAFTITVSNAGPGDAYDVLVTDTLPAGMEWTSSTPGVVIVDGILTYDVGTLAAGASVVLHISAATTMAMSGMVGNAVFVTTSNSDESPLIATAIVTVENCPPVSVTGLVREGVHHQPTRIVVSFNGALDPATASNPANYQLSMFAPHRPGVLIPLSLKEVIYDPFTQTVTLFPTRLLNVHYRYQLVISGVEDICGNPIVGNSPDGSYVTTFGREALRIGIAPPHGSTVPRPPALPISWAHRSLLERVAAGNGPNSARAQQILSQIAMNGAPAAPSLSSPLLWHARQLVSLAN